MNKAHERLFFALWPDDKVRHQLDLAYSRFSDLQEKGRRVPVTNLHMTLHFLGNIPLAGVDCFIQQVKNIKSRKFSLQIESRGYFKKPKIVWFGPGNIPQELRQLHDQLGEQICSCDFTPEQRDYNPHITMARKINHDPGNQSIEPVYWELDRFVLVISEPVAGGVRYRVKASFPLS